MVSDGVAMTIVGVIVSSVISPILSERVAVGFVGVGILVGDGVLVGIGVLVGTGVLVGIGVFVGIGVIVDVGILLGVVNLLRVGVMLDVGKTVGSRFLVGLMMFWTIEIGVAVGLKNKVGVGEEREAIFSVASRFQKNIARLTITAIISIEKSTLNKGKLFGCSFVDWVSNPSVVL